MPVELTTPFPSVDEVAERLEVPNSRKTAIVSLARQIAGDLDQGGRRALNAVKKRRARKSAARKTTRKK